MKKFNTIILARAGSKRLPGKNFSVELTPGNTLLKIAIKKALEVTGNCIISSDKEFVLEQAEKEGAKTILSPHHTDESSSVDAVLYVTQELKLEGEVLLMQLTSPLVSVETLKKALYTYEETPLFAAKKMHQICWAWSKTSPIFPQYQGIRSQDLPLLYLPCGAFYLVSVNHLKKHKNFMTLAQPFEIPTKETIDIDTKLDLEYAKCLL